MQRVSMLVALLGLVAGPVGAVSQGSVEERLVAQMEKISRGKPVWDDHDPARGAVVLWRREARGGRVTLWARGRVLERIGSSEPLSLLAGVFGFYSARPAGEGASKGMKGFAQLCTKVDPVLEEVLKKHGIERALLLDVQPELGGIGKLTPDVVQAQFGGVEGLVLAWWVHEGFHLERQFPTWWRQPGAPRWPLWDAQPDRKATIEACYGGGRMSVLHRRERGALLRAMRLLLAGERAEGLEAARLFVELRRQRRDLLHEVAIESTAGAAVTAELAEDLMELEEGVAQYVSLASAMGAGLVSWNRLHEMSVRPLSEPYYVTGSLQLLVLAHLWPDRIGEITRGIATSRTPEGAVFPTFERLVMQGQEE